MREFLKRTLPPDVLDAFRHVRHTVRCKLGTPLRGGEAIVEFVDSTTVKKTYLPSYFDFCAQYDRPLEGELLASHQDNQFVRLFEHSPTHILLERLASPLGDYHHIRTIHNPDALFSFLDTIEETLERHELRHHDMHPGNILYDPAQATYKLIDFGWSRERHDVYALPTYLNSKYSPDDSTAVEMLKREADTFLSQPGFLGKLLKRDRNAETQRARGLAV